MEVPTLNLPGLTSFVCCFSFHFKDSRGVVMVDYLEKGKTIVVGSTMVLTTLREIIKEKLSKGLSCFCRTIDLPTNRRFL